MKNSLNTFQTQYYVLLVESRYFSDFSFIIIPCIAFVEIEEEFDDDTADNVVRRFFLLSEKYNQFNHIFETGQSSEGNCIGMGSMSVPFVISLNWLIFCLLKRSTWILDFPWTHHTKTLKLQAKLLKVIM